MKRKGSRYEREFVERCQDAGLVAHRVPLSGAMAGYPDDVVVADQWRIECKYRSNGSGFKKLYDWLAGHELLELHTPDAPLLVMELSTWCKRRMKELDGLSVTHEAHQRRTGLTFSMLRRWVGESDYLAVRMPRSPWLVVKFT